MPDVIAKRLETDDYNVRVHATGGGMSYLLILEEMADDEYVQSTIAEFQLDEWAEFIRRNAEYLGLMEAQHEAE